MTPVMDSLDSFGLELERADAARVLRDPSWLKVLRARAAERFHSVGFPTTADEEWRFTSVAPIADGRFLHADNGGPGLVDLTPFSLSETALVELVFVNGRYRPELSRAKA